MSVFAEDHRPDRVDYFCPLLSLPLGVGTTLATVPPIPDGLAADPARSAIWARRLGNERRPRIGIAWSGNPSHISDHHRSIPLELWRDLLTFDAQWISIQKDLRPSDAHALSASGRVADFADDLVDFEDTAALIAQLDLVIAVDTSSAHLAAILGKPVWLLLAATPDWRWLRDRADSPWYKSVQLFRQEIHGNWAPVFADIKRRLQAAR